MAPLVSTLNRKPQTLERKPETPHGTTAPALALPPPESSPSYFSSLLLLLVSAGLSIFCLILSLALRLSGCFALMTGATPRDTSVTSGNPLFHVSHGLSVILSIAALTTGAHVCAGPAGYEIDPKTHATGQLGVLAAHHSLPHSFAQAVVRLRTRDAVLGRASRRNSHRLTPRRLVSRQREGGR